MRDTERGWQLYRAGRVADALAVFDSLLDATPDDNSAVLGRGRCHRVLGAFEDATVDFTRAHELRPGAARPLFERGAIFILMGCYDESLADYEAASDLEPAYPGVASYFAELFLYTGRAREALAVSEQGAQDEPTDLVHRVNRAHAYLLLGESERACRAYAELADRIDPGKGMSGAAIALGDFALMRSAGIKPPELTAFERRLRRSGSDEAS